MKRKIKRFKHNSITNAFINHIENNFKIYFFSIIIFIIGIVVGVIIVNNMSDLQTSNLYSYVNDIIYSLKNNSITRLQIIKTSILKNTLIVFIIWIFALTVLGKYFLNIILFILGINFGYSLSCILYVLGLNRGLLFAFSMQMVLNIIVPRNIMKILNIIV